MKPIRDYSDGQWLLLLWAFIVVFLVAGVAISTPVLIVAILAALGAGYTTYLYVREQIAQRSDGTLPSEGTPPSDGSTADADPSSADTNEGGTP
ncbi:MAG TPA: hypothetical protein VLR26_18670 [Frankiaceae bacterium]|nr:hypothetical protein [Frankiaceae bacterium]